VPQDEFARFTNQAAPLVALLNDYRQQIQLALAQ